jgi:hypothetical protein
MEGPSILEEPMVRFAWVGVVLVLLGACQMVTEPRGPGLEVRVVAVTHPASDGWAAEFQVINNGRRGAFLSRCDWISSVVEREQDGVWVEASGAACQTIHDMSPIAIAPGEALSGARGGAGPGRYRLRLGVKSDLAGEYQWIALSDEFSVP